MKKKNCTARSTDSDLQINKTAKSKVREGLVQAFRSVFSYSVVGGKFFRSMMLGLVVGFVPIQVALAVPGDADNDGIADTIDLDDDNDGILDGVENPGAATLVFDASDLPSPAKTYTNLSGSGLDVAVSHSSPASVTNESFLGPTVWTLP